MPKTKPTKRDAILNAMLDIVVERGLHDAPMSLVAERSEASAGVIYHYFASKDEIIQAPYIQVRKLKRASMLEGYIIGMDMEEAFILLARNIYSFHRKHKREMRFLEQFNASGLPKPPEEALELKKTPTVLDFEARFRPHSKGGALADLPQEVLTELTLGVLARLAALPKSLPDKTIREIATRTWLAIKA